MTWINFASACVLVRVLTREVICMHLGFLFQVYLHNTDYIWGCGFPNLDDICWNSTWTYSKYFEHILTPYFMDILPY